MSLKSKITLTVFLLILVASVGLISLAYTYFANEFKTEVAKQQSGLVSELVLQLDEKLAIAQRQIVSVASEITLQDLVEPTRLQNAIDREKDARVFFDAGFSVVDAHGRLLAESPHRTGRRGEIYADWEHLRESFSRGVPCISEPYRSLLPGHLPVISFIAPIKGADGRVAAVIAGHLKLSADTFIGKIGRVKIGKSGYFYLFTAKRVIVMHPNPGRILEKVEPGRNKGLDRAIAGFEGITGTVNSQGQPGLVMFKRLKSVDWSLAGHYPLAEAYAPIFKVRTQLVVAVVLVDLLLVVIVWLLMARMTAPLIRFAGHISELPGKPAEERFIAMDTPDEIGKLANAFNAMVFDLEEQRLVLERNEQQFRTLVEFAHDLIVWKAPNNQIIYITPNCRDLTGYDDTDFYGDHALLDSIVHPDDRPVWDWHRMHHDEQGEHAPIDLRFVCRDGSIRWMNHACRLVMDDQGAPAGIRGSFRDVSERIVLESRLEEEKSFVENIIQNATLPIFVLGQDHRVLFWNRACEELTGHKAERMIGTTDHWQPFYPQPRPTLSDLILDGSIDQIDRYYEVRRSSEGIPGGYQSEGWFQSLNGRKRYLFFDAAPVCNRDGTVVAVIETLKDMTDLKEAEEEVRKLSRAVEQSPNSIVITDTDGRITYVNPKFSQVTGYSSAEALGENPRILKSGELPAEGYKELWETIRSGREWRGEFHNRKKNGELFWESASISAIKDQDGKVTHFIAVKEDITARKLQERELQKSRAELLVKNEKMKHLLASVETSKKELEGMYAELQAAQAQMLQREKMASIGQLAAGVAHEINNPIGFITSNLGTLDKYVGRMIEYIQAQEGALSSIAPPDVVESITGRRKTLKIDYVVDDSRKLILESLDGTERVRKIVQNLKSFSRVDEAEYKHANINECLESTLNIVWNELKYKATVTREFGELPETRCFPQQLNQVFMNLLVNAAHAINQQGAITIRSWSEGTDIFVAISDTGSGIPDDIRDRIFEPFFTTKEVGKGTGLGLSISYDIVRKHGGEILVASELGKGTTFTVRLPVTE